MRRVFPVLMLGAWLLPAVAFSQQAAVPQSPQQPTYPALTQRYQMLTLSSQDFANLVYRELQDRDETIQKLQQQVHTLQQQLASAKQEAPKESSGTPPAPAAETPKKK